jgi:hypothetical protein
MGLIHKLICSAVCGRNPDFIASPPRWLCRLDIRCSNIEFDELLDHGSTILCFTRYCFEATADLDYISAVKERHVDANSHGLNTRYR